MVDAAQMNPDVTLDLSGVSCPGPIIGAKKLVSELAEGEILLLISDCPATNEELHTWAERTGNSVVKTQRMAGGHTGYYLRRGRRVQAQPHVSLDMRGSVCPGPILEARKVFAAMASGELLCLASNCPGSRADVEGWARATGSKLEAVIEVGPHDWEFYIRKA